MTCSAENLLIESTFPQPAAASAEGAMARRTGAAPGRRRALWWLRSMVLTAGLLAMAPRAWAEYTISPGDIVALTVTGFADLNTKSLVDADGKIVLPLVGAVSVSGLSLAEATAKVQAALPSKDLDHRLEDGRTVPVFISPSKISLTMAEYRPIYVSGDVAKPGEIPYRPGLTVRQAAALAGGFDLVRFKLDNPLMQISELNGEANGLWVEYAQSQASIARLQAELHDKPQIDAGSLVSTPLGKGLTDNMVTIEQDQLDTRNVDFAKEHNYLTNASQKEAQRVEILNQQEDKEIEALKNDTADLQRFEDLFKKGAIALPSVTEARRTVLGSSTRALETTAALTSVEREQGELNRRLEKLSDSRRMQLLHDLQMATATAAGLQVKLQAVTTKLRYVGAVKSQLVRGFDSQVQIDITRSSNGKSSHITGSADFALQPGDVVEIVLPASDPLVSTQ